MMDLYYRIIDAFQGTYTGRIIYNFFELLLLIGPYFIISVFLNAVIRYYFIDKKLFRFTKSETLTIIIASFIGIASPLPTYIAVPMGISLLNTGIPFSAVAAFIISSPL